MSVSWTVVYKEFVGGGYAERQIVTTNDRCYAGASVMHMRVGVYVDGFNLYYGGLSQLGSTPGWKWIDLRTLAARYVRWPGASVGRVAYCTARVNDPDDPTQTERQGFYLKALKLSGSVDVIEEGYYASWTKESVMTAASPGTRAPSVMRDPQNQLSWSSGLPVRRRNSDGVMFATVRKREEKGSDVNVATTYSSTCCKSMSTRRSSFRTTPILLCRSDLHVNMSRLA